MNQSVATANHCLVPVMPTHDRAAMMMMPAAPVTILADLDGDLRELNASHGLGGGRGVNGWRSEQNSCGCSGNDCELDHPVLLVGFPNGTLNHEQGKTFPQAAIELQRACGMR